MSAIANTGHAGKIVVPGMTAAAPEGDGTTPAGAVTLAAGAIERTLATINLGGMTRLCWRVYLPETGVAVAAGAEIILRTRSQGVPATTVATQGLILQRVPTLVGIFAYMDGVAPIVGETATLSLQTAAGQLADAVVFAQLWASSN